MTFPKDASESAIDVAPVVDAVDPVDLVAEDTIAGLFTVDLAGTITAVVSRPDAVKADVDVVSCCAEDTALTDEAVVVDISTEGTTAAADVCTSGASCAVVDDVCRRVEVEVELVVLVIVSRAVEVCMIGAIKFDVGAATTDVAVFWIAVEVATDATDDAACTFGTAVHLFPFSVVVKAPAGRFGLVDVDMMMMGRSKAIPVAEEKSWRSLQADRPREVLAK